MNITENRISQMRDYLTQIKNLPGPPKISHKMIATRLKVSEASVSRFFNPAKNTPKIVEHFFSRYADECSRWPQTADKIGRVLNEGDAKDFLGLSEAPLQAVPLPPPPTAPKSVSKQAPKGGSLLSLFKPAAAKPAPKSAPKPPSAPMPKMIARSNMCAPIAISYRGHQTEKDGKGMLFDHMRIQTITHFPTSYLVPGSEDNVVGDEVQKLFRHVIKNHSVTLPYGINPIAGRKVPPRVFNCADEGLLLIPGRVRAVEDESIRLAHEYKIIREALNRGQPLLGICAGSWRIWEQLLVWTKYPDFLNADPAEWSQCHYSNRSIIPVRDHVYNGGMIRLSEKDGISAIFNVLIHDIKIKNGSTLKKIMGVQEKQITENGVRWKINREDNPETEMQIPVNSVHWKAVNPEELPENIKIGAVSVKSPIIAIKTRQSTLMDPEENTVESFESDRGAPIMSFQWHPEGHEKTSLHGKVLKYMAQAGNAYAAKRAMLKEFQEVNGSQRPASVV